MTDLRKPAVNGGRRTILSRTGLRTGRLVIGILRPGRAPNVRPSGQTARTESSYRKDVQGLRAIAVLLVALNHAGLSGLKGGYVGVDVFFVLSGFLITGLLMSGAAKSGPTTLADFYARRARRILPAAALTLVATDVAAYALLNFVRAKQVLHDSIPASLFVANFHFASQGADYFAQGQPPSPIQHYWSLAVEEQFYLVWPLILLVLLLGAAVWRRAGGRPRGHRATVNAGGVRRLFVVLAVIGAASLAWSVHYTDTHPAASYFSTFTRAWELALGAALAISVPLVSRIPAGVRAALGWLGIAAIGVATVGFSSSTPFPGLAAVLPTVGAALVIAAGLGRQHARLALGRMLSTRPLRFIGDRSYAFYLWHWPVLIIAMQYEGHALSVGTNLLLLLGAFAISVVSYGVFENPIRRAHWSSPNQALVLWPVSVLAVIIVAGWGIGRIDVRATRLADLGAPQYPGLAAGSVEASASSAAAPQIQTVVPPPPTGRPLAAVVAAAEAAQRAAPIPSPLNLPVASLLSDHYNYPPGCAPEDGQSTSNICSLGDTAGTRTLAVLGDSHAQMWMPTILGMAHRDGWVVRPITKSSCTPVKWWHVIPSTPDCSAWYGWAIKQIEAMHPTVTLIAGEFSGLARHDAAATSGIRSLVARIRPNSVHVVVMADSPQLEQQPVDCLLASGANMARCSRTLDDSQLGIAASVAAATGSAHAAFLDTQPWLCFGGICPMVIGRTIAFFDYSHVSATYAFKLSGVFRLAFRRAIAQRG